MRSLAARLLSNTRKTELLAAKQIPVFLNNRKQNGARPSEVAGRCRRVSRVGKVLCGLLLLAIPALASDADWRQEYARRRAALRKALPDAVVALVGGTEAERGDLRSGFQQESNFYYLTGWREPGALAILTPGGDYLLLPKRSDVRERYTGKKASPEDSGIGPLTGFDHVLSTDEFGPKLRELADNRSVFTLEKVSGAEKVKEALGGKEIQDATLAVARLRMVKSAREVEQLQVSIDASVAAHLAAWKRMAAGLFEYQIAATMGNTYFERGCERHAYPPIVGSGPNSIVLHYGANRRRMDQGELLLMDVGAECSSYAADLTRTVPVSGRFTPRQREVYDIVLGAQNAAIAAARPGMKLTGTGAGTLNQIALDYVNAHGKDLKGAPLGKYYLHQLGHHVGLDVHDATDGSIALAPGMVVTIEPGLYIAEENIGIRIEDMILITENGAKLLSGALPREAGDIEKALKRRK
ncbi:MAG: aminopeptidase P family protein [Acidobacteriia bacterium]|nr:aminopeptidase P family protein [Terriglobia bacterium]